MNQGRSVAGPTIQLARSRAAGATSRTAFATLMGWASLHEPGARATGRIPVPSLALRARVVTLLAWGIAVLRLHRRLEFAHQFRPLGRHVLLLLRVLAEVEQLQLRLA